jgi:hypothetical protein
MKKVFAILMLISLTSAIVVPNQPIQNSTKLENSATTENLEKGKLVYHEGMKKSDIENFIGRKLNLSEKISFLVDKKATVERLSNTQAERNGFNGLAIAGFASAVVGIFLLPVVFSSVGLVLSAIALSQIKKKNQGGKGLAIAGLVAGIVGAAWAVLVLAAIL